MEAKEYLSSIGRKGGKSKSVRKSEASRRNVAKAREAKQAAASKEPDRV
jgi:hypothetical protein